MRPQQILDLVDDEQREAVVAGPGPLLVVAGAGTGKTRTLTTRVAYRVATREILGAGVLAVTHSTRAAGEMRDRLRRFGVDGLEQVAARTLHAAALAQLRYFWPRTGRAGDLQVCNDRFGAMRAALSRLGAGKVDPALVADLLSEVEWAKASLVTPQGYEEAAIRAGRAVGVSHTQVAAAYAGYQASLAHAGQLDFTDLLTEAAALVEQHLEVAAEIRTRYPTLCVDEYQDVDPAQQRLIDAWLGPGHDLTVVGDPRQAIYAFKGALPAALSTFPQRYPGATVVALTKDYRSTPQVVLVANALAAAGDPDPGRAPRGKAARASWVAAHPAPLVGMLPNGVTATARQLPDEATEARWIAAQISAAIRSGTAPEQIAILYRFNAQAAPFEQALTAADIPYRIADGDRFFDRVEIVTVLDELRRRVHAEQQSRPYPDGRFTDDEAEWGNDDADESPGTLVSGADLLREVLADAGWARSQPPPGVGAARDRWESRLALVELVEQLPGADLWDAPALLADLDARRAEAHQVTTRAVTLATVHKAKGLEWDVVFCPRWVEGSLPISFAQTDEAVAEERRLAYVAVTRARKSLTVSHAATRTFGRDGASGSRPARPSRFLSEAGFVMADGTVRAPGPPARGRRRSSREEQTVTRCARCATPLTDVSLVKLGTCTTHLTGDAGRRWVMLREWRADMSRMDGVPPYRVLPDAALLALLAQAPTTLEALAQVKGIGPAKLARYGTELLGLIAWTPA